MDAHDGIGCLVAMFGQRRACSAVGVMTIVTVTVVNGLRGQFLSYMADDFCILCSTCNYVVQSACHVQLLC